MPAKSLWTPNGHIPLQEKDVYPLTREEIAVLSKLQDLAYKFKWAIVCQKCDQSITGKNQDGQPVLSVACGCSEYRYRYSDRGL